MAEKQSLNATFFAFEKRERSGVLWGASIAYAVIGLAIGGAFVALNWQAFTDYITWTATLTERAAEATDPADPFAGAMPPASVMTMGAWYVPFMAFFYILLASYEAACLRWLIRGETKGFFGLALDGDTWRVYFGYWIWFFLLMAVYMVLVFTTIGAFAGAAISAQNDPQAMLGALPVLFGASLLVIVLLIYFGVRFAPAAATSVAKQRFAFFDAWTVTKGRFWALLGSFVLLWLMYFVGLIVLSTAAMVVMGTTVFSQMQTGAEPATPSEAFGVLASPSVWIPIALAYGAMIVGAFVFYVALFGVNARAARAALEEGKIAPGAQA